MHLNRFLTLLRDEIRAEENKLGTGGDINAKWSSDVGMAIQRYQHQKKQIEKSRQQIEEAEPLLETLDKLFLKMQQDATTLHGADKGRHFIRSLISGLRTANMRRARKALRDFLGLKKKLTFDQGKFQTLQKEIKLTAQKTMDLIENNIEQLSMPDSKLYLRPHETALIEKSNIQEMKKINSYLLKYHLPYMQSKVDRLFHLKDKLLVVGSLESLMTLYKKLMVGLATPLDDMRKVRQYESNVVNRITYLLDTQFQEVNVIRGDAEELVKEFRAGRAAYEALQESAAVLEQQEAQLKSALDKTKAAESA